MMKLDIYRVARTVRLLHHRNVFYKDSKYLSKCEKNSHILKKNCAGNPQLRSTTQTAYFPQKYFVNNYAQRTLFSSLNYENHIPLTIITSQRRAASRKSGKKDQYYSEKGHSSRTKLYYALKQYIRSQENAETFVSHLKEEEKKYLLAALESSIGTTSSNATSGEDSGKITNRQLCLVFIHNCIPFIGFGFLDNAIMILAGEYIDLKIGVAFGISTMAAAALGNTISDIAGIGLAGYVEMLFYKLGLPVPALTPEQAEQTSTMFSSNAGKAFGILLGCIIGMFPLLLIGKDEKEEAD